MKQKNFLITGASRGIGRALAETIAQNGGNVAINGRNPESLDAVLKSLNGLGGKVIAASGDVGIDEDAQRITGAAYAGLGEIDVLVNNAAILAPRATVTETPATVWEEVLRINVIGTANMIRHVLPRMEKRKRGLIINLSSGWGREAAGWVASYCASKFAVEALTQSVSEETAGTGVIVFALSPGIVATEMLATAFAGEIAAYPSPAELAPRWTKLFASVSPSWHGTSRDLFDY